MGNLNAFCFPQQMSSLLKCHIMAILGKAELKCKHYVIVNKQSHVAPLCGKHGISLLWCWFHYKKEAV